MFDSIRDEFIPRYDAPLYYQTRDTTALLDFVLAETPACPEVWHQAADPKPTLLVGEWSGSFTYGAAYGPNSGIDDGWCSLTISADSDGVIIGSGVDLYGPFTIDGTVNKEDAGFIFIMRYQLPWDDDRSVQWRCQGSLSTSEGQTRMSGVWGLPLPRLPGNDDDNGDFSFQRTPIQTLIPDPLQYSLRADRSPTNLKRVMLTAILREHDERLGNRRLYWEILRIRRLQRKRFIEITRLRLDNGDFLPIDLISEWTDLVKSIHPYDLCQWRAMALYQTRRELIRYKYVLCQSGVRHLITTHSAECDGCSMWPIISTGYLCIVCSEDQSHGVSDPMDLCSNCFRDKGHVTAKNAPKRVHLPSHSTLQIRSAVCRSYDHSLMQLAKRIVSVAISSTEALSCAECHTQVDSRPYWCCVDCRSGNAPHTMTL